MSGSRRMRVPRSPSRVLCCSVRCAMHSSEQHVVGRLTVEDCDALRVKDDAQWVAGIRRRHTL
eukprot:scaffold37070_cov19-Prasinocladus_malaysianus.AAC.1